VTCFSAARPNSVRRCDCDGASLKRPTRSKASAPRRSAGSEGVHIELTLPGARVLLRRPLEELGDRLIDGPLCEFGLAWFTGKRRAVIDPQPPRQPYPCRHPYPRIIAARHYLGFPGKARSVLPLLSPSEVDPPASARAERPRFGTFTATRDATRAEMLRPTQPVGINFRNAVCQR
jgi:hypothetical protein